MTVRQALNSNPFPIKHGSERTKTPLSGSLPINHRIVTVTQKNSTSIDYRKKVEERFGKSVVEQYLTTYFSSYEIQVKNNDKLVFKLLARLLRRQLNLHRVSLLDGKAAQIQENKSKLDPLAKEIQELNQQGSYIKARKKLIIIYHKLKSVKTINSKNSASIQHKLYKLKEDNQPIDPSLLRKIGIVISAIMRLFCRLFPVQDNWNEIPAEKIPKGKKLLLGSIPNSLSWDAKTLKKSGVRAVLSLLEPFESEKRSLSRPYSYHEWAAHEIIQGEIEAKDHEPLDPEQLSIAADFIHNHLEEGNVYVHCKGGAGRSNMAIAAYLIKYCDYSVEEAKQLIMKHRKQSTLYKQERLDALDLFEQYLSLVNKLKTSLEKQTEPLQQENNKSLLLAQLAAQSTDLSEFKINLITTTTCEYHIEILLNGASYYATVLKDDPSKIRFTNLKPQSLKEEDQSDWENIKKNNEFMMNLRRAAQTYITSTFDQETAGRYGYTFQVNEEPPTALQLKDNPDSVTKQVESFTQKDSAAYHLFRILLTQTGLAATTILTTLQDETGNYFLNPQNTPEEGTEFTAIKKRNIIEITTFLSIVITNIGLVSTTPQGRLKVVHKMDITDMNAPKLSTHASFSPKTSL